MKREIKLCLVYRDMWQSSGKFMPRQDQLVQVADDIVAMNCFHRVETNGGGFEQIKLLAGENPNTTVRTWTEAFNKAGIQTQMLERGLNGIRMSPVPKDVRQLMFKLKKIQGTDISRSFDGLNNPQNLELSFQYAREGGMIAQGALSLTFSPIHTVDYYVNLADQYIERGAEEICIKDMAGIGRPSSIGKIVKEIKRRHPNVTVQYHGHSTPGLSIVSSLEAARAGADYIDVGMEPLSWGTGHADLISVHAMLKDDGFAVADYDMDAYMEVRNRTQSFIDDFLGYFINPKNRFMNSILLKAGLPGGMMGSLMADLEKNLKSLNKWKVKNNQAKLSQDELLMKLFNEVEYAWPKLGYPPLVTPFSQYVKNTSLMNVIQMEKGKERWSMIDENTWGMLLGKSGKLPGQLGQEILDLAEQQKRSFFEGNPQDLYEDELDMYRKKMEEKNWEVGQDDEELFEYAMHPKQYEDLKSGIAKSRFDDMLAEKRSESDTVSGNVSLPQEIEVEVEGQKYFVGVKSIDAITADNSSDNNINQNTQVLSNLKSINAPLEGTFYLTKSNNESGVKIGDTVSIGDTVAYIESMKVINAVAADKGGVVMEILPKHGAEVEEDDVLIKIQ